LIGHRALLPGLACLIHAIPVNCFFVHAVVFGVEVIAKELQQYIQSTALFRYGTFS